MPVHISDRFPRYTRFDPKVPVWCVTPGEGRTMHRFFDTSPISPSGRYVGLTRFPFEDRLPKPGDVAQIVVVDLQTAEERVVAETRGWDTQLGAQTQWGADDTQLLFNDMDIKEWRPYGVRMNPLTGEKKALDGPVFSEMRKWRMVRKGDFKLVVEAERFSPTMLFDLKNDPYEQKNLIDDTRSAPVIEDLRRELDMWRKECERTKV